MNIDLIEEDTSKVGKQFITLPRHITTSRTFCDLVIDPYMPKQRGTYIYTQHVHTRTHTYAHTPMMLDPQGGIKALRLTWGTMAIRRCHALRGSLLPTPWPMPIPQCCVRRCTTTYLSSIVSAHTTSALSSYAKILQLLPTTTHEFFILEELPW